MSMPSSFAIDARQLAKTFTSSEGAITLFNALDLQIKQGERVAILGASGSGKSTLLSLLACLDTPSAGTISLAGTDLNTLDNEAKARWRAENISFVFQSFHLLNELTALENVQLPLDIQGVADSQQQAAHWLEQVGLGARMNHLPAQLSGGERQRVAIARAFVTRPSLLFADEPTGNLDTKTGEKIISLLFEVSKESGSTLILITHDPQLANRCDRQFLLADGQLTEQNL
ncbi:ABC transporter ATP-binding protein [Aliamphritea spongicola]|uniref:ABC transporter ATP-binding protein n=1 Tax=Aliamphritea spongicola TaxID=707589 RepID=UPI001FAFD82E|nr:ABC transporter ATP-binding protein [Aliamphritea spongicola]